MLETTQARAGGCSPKNSLKTVLKAEKSRGSSARPTADDVFGAIAGFLQGWQEGSGSPGEIAR